MHIYIYMCGCISLHNIAYLHVCTMPSQHQRPTTSADYRHFGPGYGDSHHFGAEVLFGGRVQGQRDPRVTCGTMRSKNSICDRNSRNTEELISIKSVANDKIIPLTYNYSNHYSLVRTKHMFFFVSSAW